MALNVSSQRVMERVGMSVVESIPTPDEMQGVGGAERGGLPVRDDEGAVGTTMMSLYQNLRGRFSTTERGAEALARGGGPCRGQGTNHLTE